MIIKSHEMHWILSIAVIDRLRDSSIELGSDIMQFLLSLDSYRFLSGIGNYILALAVGSHSFHETTMHLPNPSLTSRIQHKINFYVEKSWFEFRIFLLGWLPKETSLPYYLPIDRERTHGFMPFLRVLA